MIIYRFFDEVCNDIQTCHSHLTQKLETETGLILQCPDTGDKIVNGGLSVWHFDQGHLLRAEIYEKDIEPNAANSFCKLKKPDKSKLDLLNDRINELPQAPKPNIMFLEKLRKTMP